MCVHMCVCVKACVRVWVEEQSQVLGYHVLFFFEAVSLIGLELTNLARLTSQCPKVSPVSTS